jgi:hypothetical protein
MLETAPKRLTGLTVQTLTIFFSASFIFPSSFISFSFQAPVAFLI